jgi:hypothetical protein
MDGQIGWINLPVHEPFISELDGISLAKGEGMPLVDLPCQQFDVPDACRVPEDVLHGKLQLTTLTTNWEVNENWWNQAVQVLVQQWQHKSQGLCLVRLLALATTGVPTAVGAAKQNQKHVRWCWLGSSLLLVRLSPNHGVGQSVVVMVQSGLLTVCEVMINRTNQTRVPSTSAAVCSVARIGAAN